MEVVNKLVHHQKSLLQRPITVGFGGVEFNSTVTEGAITAIIPDPVVMGQTITAS